MATSQNGWKANDRSLVASYDIGGGKIAVRKGDVATILVYVAKRFDSEVENLVWPGNWGYAERPIRGSSTTLSNHASGTAIDLNAPQHPLGKQGTFSKSQVSKIKKILADCGGVIRWGGNYSGRKDEMHFEINAGSARVREVAKAIRAGKKPGPSGGAEASGGSSSPTYKQIYLGDLLKTYVKGTPVEDVQEHLGIKADGYYGDDTAAAVGKFQKAHGLDDDKIVGDDTWAALKKDGMKPSASDKPKKAKVPDFPLPSGHWYGPESSNPKNHSGYYKADRAGIKQFQQKLKDRGWTIDVDGLFGSGTSKVIKQFQDEKGLSVDGGVGSDTWKAIWSEPVT